MRTIYTNPIPTDWLQLPLSSLTKRRRGYSWEKAQELLSAEADAIPVIRIPNIQAELDLRKLLWLKDVAPEDIAAFAVQKNWILFVASNGNPDRIGDAVLIRKDEKLLIASFLQAIAPKSESDLLPEYLFHWLRLHVVHEIFSKTSQQTTGLSNFSWGAVKSLSVRFPRDVDEQRRIISILNIAENSLRAAQAQHNEAKTTRAALLQHVFTKGLPGRHKLRSVSCLRFQFEIPVDWCYDRLGRWLESVEYGTNAPSNDRATGFPVIAIPQVIAPVLKRDNWPHASVPEDEAARLRLQEGDVLLIRTNGNSEYIGKSTVISREIAEQHVIFASYLLRARTKATQLKGRYLNQFLHSSLGRRQCQTMANTSAGNHNLGARSLRQFWMPLPPPNEQEEILQVAEASQRQIDRLADKCLALARVRDRLREDLLSGRTLTGNLMPG